MQHFTRLFLSICLSIFFLIPGFSQSKKELKTYKKAEKKLSSWQHPLTQRNQLGDIKIDTFNVDLTNKKLSFEFSTPLSYVPVREETHQLLLGSLRESLGKKFRNYEIDIRTDGQNLESLIPNHFRKSMAVDSSRFPKIQLERIPLVRSPNSEQFVVGLYNRNIALWHSHGWYYEAKLDRWEWQRARLYTTVEDIFPLTFVIPYLAPMLENAGANVFMPRERDMQIHEVIIDNDRSSAGSEMLVSGVTPQILKGGFLKKDTLFIGENPFKLGTYLKMNIEGGMGHIDYIPGIPETGEYAVYVSYKPAEVNTSNAKYTVFHTGGQTSFLVNQKIGGSTWIYLGTFHFKEGKNPVYGSVRLSGNGNIAEQLTADAVRFGGGMGSVARKPSEELLPNQWSLKGGTKGDANTIQKADPDLYRWETSARPRYQEGARYYLQYAGAPDSLVYSLNEGKNDYNDDYQSRGEWVNYLMGAPNGPNVDRNAQGLHIPIDLSLAFHTDAGVKPKESTIGTLAIYSSIRDDGKFPSGQSKLASRDLSDVLQSEIVHDIRSQFKPDWSRRGLWNRQYSEAWRPNVPAMLLELLSHQNLTDMQYGHDPRFKFAVSRAIYKGIVKYLALPQQSLYVIQPLPVNHFSISRIGDKKVLLKWKVVLDSLEPSAAPTKYKVYQRIDDGGFNNGMVVEGNSAEITLPEFGITYSFKVTALNDGGESFPSEILSVGLLDNKKQPVLVVNAFDRVAAPAVFDEGDFAGFAYWEDEGVADKYNLGYTGKQYDFDRKSAWLDDDSPGWGASYGNMEAKLIPGNSFDNTILHGKAILEAGYSFVSTSDEAFTETGFDHSDYQAVDLLFGEEKTEHTFSGQLFRVFDKEMQIKIRQFTDEGGHVFASGAHIGTDHVQAKDSMAMKFANEVLHFKWRTNHAVRIGGIATTDEVIGIFEGAWKFNTEFHPKIYKVEAPDAIEPVGENATVAFRYKENNAAAGIAFDGKYKTVMLGFPFETIVDEQGRNALMKQILDFFEE